MKSVLILFFIFAYATYCMRIKTRGCFDKPTPAVNFSLPVNDSGSWNDQCQNSLDSDFTNRDRPQFDPNCASINSTWGPQPLVSNFPSVSVSAPAGCNTVQWAQKRLLKAIDFFIKKEYNYCHHHTGNWTPPLSPRDSLDICLSGGDPTQVNGTCSNAKNVWNGVDCSHYTSWVYLFGFGMYLDTAVGNQGCSDVSPGKWLPYGRDDQGQFKPGDLLFLKNSGGDKITHVIFWTGIAVDFDNPNGPFGNSTLLNNVPQCQYTGVRNQITNMHVRNQTVYVISDSHWNGPNYRIFAGWWYNAFSHAKRIINPDPSLPQITSPRPQFCS